MAALFLHRVLPILRNTLLAFPVILAGVRTSLIVNVGTATIGATIGAGGLGAPIISGLVNQNPAFLTEGTIIVGPLALTIDAAFAALEQRLRPASGAGR